MEIFSTKYIFCFEGLHQECILISQVYKQVLFQWAPREDEPPLPPAVPAEETSMMPPHPPQSVDGRGGELPLLLLSIK